MNFSYGGYSLIVYFIMKKLLIFTVMFALLGLTASAEAGNTGRRDVAISDKKPQKGNHHHRAPELVPVECFYDGFSRQVEISFRTGSGEATVLLSNLVTGETATVTETGAVIFVPVQSDGMYMVEITLSDGREYYGTFSTEEEDTK